MNGNGKNWIIALIMLIVASLTFLAGTYTDLGKNKQRIATNERDIRAIQEALRDNTRILLDIKDRLARIETKLEDQGK